MHLISFAQVDTRRTAREGTASGRTALLFTPGVEPAGPPGGAVGAQGTNLALERRYRSFTPNLGDFDVPLI